MESIQSLFQKKATSFTPYTPIEPPEEIAKRLNRPVSEIIKLDANENPYGVSPFILEKLSTEQYLHIYPDPAQKNVRLQIAKYVQFSPENIIAGAGSDELLDLICRLFLNPNDEVLTFTPTFSYYSHVVALNQGVLKTISRKEDFSIPLDQIAKINLEKVKIVFLCSPNNPSGNLLEQEVFDYFINQNCIVVVDEAYYEFCNKSFIHYIKSKPNLIILRTFSKCFGLAGLRVGYGVMSKQIVDQLMAIKPPYSVNVAAERALEVCLEHLEESQNQVQQIIITREEVKKELQKLSTLHVFPSESNFILCKVIENLLQKNAKKIKEELEQEGILIRYFNTSQLKNFIRISIGKKKEMDIFLNKFKKIIED